MKKMKKLLMMVSLAGMLATPMASFSQTPNEGGGVSTVEHDDDNDNDWGWTGILGLAGLLGLRGRKERDHVVTHRNPNV